MKLFDKGFTEAYQKTRNLAQERLDDTNRELSMIQDKTSAKYAKLMRKKAEQEFNLQTENNFNNFSKE